MMARSRIGYGTAPTSVAIDAWRVAMFCRAIGETDRTDRDDAAARVAGHVRPRP